MSLEAHLEPTVDFWHYGANVQRRRIKVLGGEAVFALRSPFNSDRQNVIAYAGIGYDDKEISHVTHISYATARHHLAYARTTLNMRERAGLVARCAATKALRVTRVIDPAQFENISYQERRALVCIGRGYNDDEMTLRATLADSVPSFIRDVANRLQLPANRALLGTVALLSGFMPEITLPPSATSSGPAAFSPNVEDALRTFAAQHPDAIAWG